MATLEEAIKQTKFANEHIKSHLNVLYSANWLYNKISSHLKPFNLTHEQFNVLRILKGSHPQKMCQKEILSRMIAPNSNITLIIKKLKEKQFVVVQQSATDKREYEINITSAGLHVLDQVAEELNAQSNFIGKLSTSEAFHLNALLDKLREE